MAQPTYLKVYLANHLKKTIERIKAGNSLNSYVSMCLEDHLTTNWVMAVQGHKRTPEECAKAIQKADIIKKLLRYIRSHRSVSAARVMAHRRNVFKIDTPSRDEVVDALHAINFFKLVEQTKISDGYQILNLTHLGRCYITLDGWRKDWLTEVETNYPEVC